MCGSVAYLCVAFLHHIAKVCEKFVNFESFFCMNPVQITIHSHRQLSPIHFQLSPGDSNSLLKVLARGAAGALCSTLTLIAMMLMCVQ